jgi:DNA-binding beta-propeller fold protein YncE
VSSIEVGQAPQGLALTPDGTLLVVAVKGANKVVFVKTATHQIVAQVEVNAPQQVAISLDGQVAFVTSHNHSELAVLNIANQTHATLALTGSSQLLSYSRGATQVYFTLLNTDSVHAYQPVTASNLNTYTKQANLTQTILNQHRSEFALVVGKNSEEIAIIDIKNSSIKRAVRVGQRPNWNVLGLDGRTTYVATENSNDIAVVDSANAKHLVCTLRAADVQPLLLFSQTVLPALN